MRTLKDPNDRRDSIRFAIERDVDYKIRNKIEHDRIGRGRTVNMSSTGVLFTTADILHLGRLVELNVSWPALLNSSVALKLVVHGRVVRYEHGYAALEIERYEFRTQGMQVHDPKCT